MSALMHTADIHIDSDVHGALNPATGRNTAWESNAVVVRHLAEVAAERKVDAFISSGDEFKTGRPSQEALLMLADALTPLADAGIPMLFLDGNHNRISVTRGHRSAIHTLAEVMRARGSEAVASAVPELQDVGPFQVATLPWMHVGATLETLGKTDASPEEADRLTAQYAQEHLERMAGAAEPGRTLIMAGHVTVGSARRGSEGDITHLFSEPVLDVEHLEALPFAYGALGHIHTPQAVNGSLYRYCGSPNRLTFTDEKDVKGANLVTFGGEPSVERVPTPARELRTIDLAQEGFREDLAALQEGTLVRLVLPEGETDVDRRVRLGIARAGAHLVLTKSRPVAPKARTRPSLPRTMSDEAALRAWAKEHGTGSTDALIGAARTLPDFIEVGGQ